MMVKTNLSMIITDQIENANKFGVPVVVCVNKFGTDTDTELKLVVEKVSAYVLMKKYQKILCIHTYFQ